MASYPAKVASVGMPLGSGKTGSSTMASRSGHPHARRTASKCDFRHHLRAIDATIVPMPSKHEYIGSGDGYAKYQADAAKTVNRFLQCLLT